jgi:triosephosphate isomerase (TIM)
MKRPVFAANWKMNHGPSDAAAFMRSFLSHYPRRSDRTVVIFPPALSFAAVAAALDERHDVLAGVQNIHWADKGAYTGETSAGIARDAGARVVLVGHSERRHIFGETDEETALKCAAAARAGLIPMLCVGETLEEREAGDTEAVVLRQLRAGLARLEAAQLPTVVVAYEPVWAIGTGRNATPDDAGTVHRTIRTALREIVGDRGGAVPILYGGSVNLANVQSLLAAPEVDGVLVGGASLEAQGWSKLLAT